MAVNMPWSFWEQVYNEIRYIYVIWKWNRFDWGPRWSESCCRLKKCRSGSGRTGWRRTVIFSKIRENYLTLSNGSKTMCMCMLMLGVICEVIRRYKSMPKYVFFYGDLWCEFCDGIFVITELIRSLQLSVNVIYIVRTNKSG